MASNYIQEQYDRAVRERQELRFRDFHTPRGQVTRNRQEIINHNRRYFEGKRWIFRKDWDDEDLYIDTGL